MNKYSFPNTDYVYTYKRPTRNISKISLLIAFIIVFLLFCFLLYHLILYIKRIRPAKACTSEGYCSVNIIPQTLLTIEDKLGHIARLYAVKHNIDPKSITFNVSEGEKSYVYQKKDIYLCIRSKNNIIYKDNTLIEVGIHELAHVISPEYCEKDNHSENFKQIYRELLDIAEQEGYYNPSIPMESNYCGYNT